MGDTSWLCCIEFRLLNDGNAVCAELSDEDAEDELDSKRDGDDDVFGDGIIGISVLTDSLFGPCRSFIVGWVCLKTILFWFRGVCVGAFGMI